MRDLAYLSLVVIGVSLSAGVRQVGAQVAVVESLTISGTVESVSPGIIVVKDADGKALTVRVQEKGKRAVTLANGGLLRFPAEIHITGSFGLESIQAGQIVRFIGQVNRGGNTEGEAREISLVSGKDTPSGITVDKEVEGTSDFSTCSIVGQFVRLSKGRMIVRIPSDNGFTGKKEVSIAVAKDAKVQFKSDDLRRAAAGARVTRLEVARLNTGDIVAKTLKIVVTTKTTSRASVDDKLLAKYRHLSDEPKAPRLIRSAHFAFMSDISDRQARVILEKLETMVGSLSRYFGAAPSGVVQGFIVHDLSVWPEGMLTESGGVAKIREEAGVCFNSSLGKLRKAVLYSCDDHGVIQHECTHGFCHLTLGSTGPTWLAEGVAEMGQYWKADRREVDISPTVISYLQQSEPKRKLLEIAIPGRTASGTWQDYAWRWALCNLLANNPNYSGRFKALAIALMEKRPGVSFASVYGPVAAQISFEYDLFLHALDNGYRADLCAWDWKTTPLRINGTRRTKKTIKAAYGWQASGLMLEKGVAYDIAAVGEWKIAKDGSVYDADGDREGRGQLLGVVFNNFELSVPVPIGKRKTFVATDDGHLFLRCKDDWNKLADNDGELIVHFRRNTTLQQMRESKTLAALATQHEQSEQYDDALTALDAAIKLVPGDLELLLQRGDLHARRKDWSKAADDFKLAPSFPLAGFSWFRGAALFHISGREEEYRKYCQQLLQHRLENNSGGGRQIARAFALAPQPSLDPRKHIELTRSSVEFRVKHLWHWGERASIEYRVGNYEQAIEFASVVNEEGGHGALEAISAGVLALAHHRLGDQKEAQIHLDRAAPLVDAYFKAPVLPKQMWHDWLHAKSLIEEARQELAKSVALPPTDSVANTLLATRAKVARLKRMISWRPQSKNLQTQLDVALAALRQTDAQAIQAAGVALKFRLSGNLVKAGSVWKYLDNNSVLKDQWIESNFDDSDWKEGPAELGYGDDDEKTVIGYGPDAKSKYITTYFRREFQAANVAEIKNMVLELVRDDGAAVYLNGIEIVRDNLGALASAEDFATARLSGDSETKAHYFNVNPALLVKGLNTLAVEVHQLNPTSSDLSFDLQLTTNVRATLEEALLAQDLHVRYYAAKMLRKLDPEATKRLIAEFDEAITNAKTPDAASLLRSLRESVANDHDLLRLFDKRITILPPEIGKMVHLRKLMLYNNRIKTIPPEIGKLKHLEWLWLGGNRLTSLPPEFGNLTNLTHLWIGRNPFTKLPPELANLKKLQVLSLEGTGISAAEIESLKKALPNCEINHD